MTNSTEKPANVAETAEENTTAALSAQSEHALNMVKDSFDQLAAHARETMNQSMKSMHVMSGMSVVTLDALLEASRIASKGLETIASEVANQSKQRLERTLTTAQSMVSAKTVPELIQMQSAFARTEFESAIAEYSKLSQTMSHTLVAVFEPLKNS
jgi:hypothetical protein